MKKAIKDVQVGDKILGTDGKWHKVIDKTEVKYPFRMFEVSFSNGVIKCSDTHQWNVFVNGKMYTTDAEGLFQEFEFYKGVHIGTADGPTLVDIKKSDPELVQCITTNAKDHQFAIYADKGDEQV